MQMRHRALAIAACCVLLAAWHAAGDEDDLDEPLVLVR